jgi:hypothetical protein
MPREAEHGYKHISATRPVRCNPQSLLTII